MHQQDKTSGHVIYAYTRAEAIADGTLIAAPDELSRSAGLGVPVALTAVAWADCVAWDSQDEARKPGGTAQTEDGRLWDVLYMTRHAMTHAGDEHRVAVELLRVPRGGRDVEPRRMRLVAMIGPGDAGEPVLTIGLPHKD